MKDFNRDDSRYQTDEYEMKKKWNMKDFNRDGKRYETKKDEKTWCHTKQVPNWRFYTKKRLEKRDITQKIM